VVGPVCLYALSTGHGTTSGRFIALSQKEYTSTSEMVRIAQVLLIKPD